MHRFLGSAPDPLNRNNPKNGVKACTYETAAITTRTTGRPACYAEVAGP